ncbi:hypothetical protein [Streptomyces sp. NPDC001717]|uniref:hypothetical protein n=1 Tax=Streptomyces sp. NPDC001717 TaxID=3364604 RepID=UPI00367802A6
MGEALDRVLDLRDHAYAWTGHPHHPGEPGAAEHDARVWDYAKDLLREELTAGEPNVHEAGDVLHRPRRTREDVCALPAADAAARVDAHHIAGRGSMAVELGHLPAARAELERLREPRRRLVDADDDKGDA